MSTNLNKKVPDRIPFSELTAKELELIAQGGIWDGQTFGVPTATAEQSNVSFFRDGDGVLHFYLDHNGVYSSLVYIAATLSTAVREPLENGARTFITFGNNTSYTLVQHLLEEKQVLGTRLED